MRIIGSETGFQLTICVSNDKKFYEAVELSGV